MACNWGTAGKKFYQGTPTADAWCQAQHQKAVSGSKSLLWSNNTLRCRVSCHIARLLVHVA